jgi:hypothetical protein
MPTDPTGFRRCLEEHRIILWVLLLALINGLVFVFIVPPWQHYDEPGHFEFAWLIANQEGIPSSGTYDQNMRRELAASMIEHDFFAGLNFRPNLLAVNEPIWIGISQISDRPLYYYLAAIPLRIVPYTDMAFQLYLVRLISLGFYLVSILAAYGIAREISPSNHPLRWMLPLGMTLLPGFTDLMTAFNSDVGATAFFSLFLWVAVRMIQRGVSWMSFIALLILAAISFWTKNTVSLVAVLPIPVMLFAFLRASRRKFAWAGVALLSLAALLLIFRWGDAASWYRQSFPNEPTRSVHPMAPHGNYSFNLPLHPDRPLPGLVQVLPQNVVQAMRGKTVTIGAWMWASEVVVVRSPLINDGHQTHFREVEIGVEPNFFSFSLDMREDLQRARLILAPMNAPPEAEILVYFDGVLLVEGSYSANQPPEFNNSQAVSGNWDGHSIRNLLRNASAESAWPWINPTFDRLIAQNYPGRPALILASLLDWSMADWYFETTLRNLFHTFWGKFGWGHVPLVGFRPYSFLGLITLVGLVGAIFMLINNKRRLPWELLFVFGFSLVFIWGAALVRGVDSILGGNIFIPSSRYAYPAIIPTIVLLVVGCYEVMRLIQKLFKIHMTVMYVSFILLFLILNITGLFSIWSYYR